MEKISVLIKNLFFICIFLIVSCTTNEKLPSIDEKSIFGVWVIDQKKTTKDRLDECVFNEDFKYVCFSYPPKNSRSDLVIDYRGRFDVKNNILILYYEEDKVLGLDERLMQKLEIFHLDTNLLVLINDGERFIYKPL